MKHILIIEDDAEISKNLTLLLSAEGYSVSCAQSRGQALGMIENNIFDIALADISLPDGNGFSLCTEIKQKQGIPVIFLTASGDETSVVTGLDMGADDYIIKPFRTRELIARIQNALRKSSTKSTVLCSGSVSLDTNSGIVRKNGEELFLSALEYRLLLIFLSNPNIIITRDRLLEELWDASGEYVNDNTLTVYIKRLRSKIENNPSQPEIILTVRGTGYRLGAG